MEEMQPKGGEQQSRLFVAMRSTDRRVLLSPSDATPDFFIFNNLDDPRIPLENRAQGLMRAHAKVNVNSDHALHMPEEEPGSQAYAVYFNSTTDFETTSGFGKFDVKAVRQARHTLEIMNQNIADFPELERREFRIKAALFQQVINLMEGKSPRAPRWR